MANIVKFDRRHTLAQAQLSTADQNTIYFTTDTHEVVIKGTIYGANYALPVASTTELGGIRLGYTQNDRNYPIILNADNQAYVNVPWTDTVYTHPTYTAKTAGESADKTLSFGETFKIPYLVSDTQGHVAASTKEVTLTMPAAPAAPNDGVLSIKSGTTEIASFTANQSTNIDFSIEAGTNISITPDATNHKVTIAGTYSYTLPTATSSVLGGVKLGSDTVQTVAASTPTSVANRTYAVQVNSAGQMVTNIPWTDSLPKWENEQDTNEIWYTSSDGNIVTPYRLDALPEIVSNVYSNEKGVIKFETDVTSIGYMTFNGCASLTSITIPDGVTSIGGDAFTSCKSLTSITIPDGVTSIGGNAFSYCKSLTSITIPNNVTSIGNGAFRGCSSLTSITIPDGVTSIEGYVFFECSSLTSATIPNSVTSIGDHAFADCNSLTSITIPDGVTSIGGNAFFRCTSLTSVTIPNSVTSIGDWAFADCNSLTSITIPDGVTSIGNYAFRVCSGLNNIVCKSSTPPILGGTSVFDSTNNCPIYVPSQSVDAYKTAANWSEYADRIVGLLNNNQMKYTASRQLTIEDGAGYTDHTFENGVGIVTFNNDLTTLSRQWSIDTFGNPNNYDEGDSSTISIITSLTLPNGVQDIHMGALLYVEDTVYYEGTQKECARISKDPFDGSGAGYYHCFDGVVSDKYNSNRIDPIHSIFGTTWLQDLIGDDENALNLLYSIGSIKIDELSMTAGEFITALVDAGLSTYGFTVVNREYNGVTIPVAYHTKSGHFIGIAKATDYEHIGISDAVFALVEINESLDPDYMYVLLDDTAISQAS